MSPNPRTPQQRDRRFARVRRLTQGILLGSGVASAVLVGYTAANAKPVTTVPVTVAAHAATTTTTHTTPSKGGSTATTAYTPPTTAPVVHTPVCTTTPSGTVICH